VKKLVPKIALLLVLQFSYSQKMKSINSELNQSDKKIIIEHLKKDEFASIDNNLIFKPEISKIDYYRLKEMEFNWEILKPLSEKVTNYCEANQFNHRVGIKILNEEQKALYFWWYLDGQVTNGGFSQFIYNGYDKYFPAILKGLKLLPNQEYYNLVEKVYLYYIQEGLENLDRDKVDYFKNKFYENDFLSKADDLYFKFNEKLYQDFEDFIRKNQSKFIQPIKNPLSGEVFEKKEKDIEESISIIDGLPNGYYIKKVKDILIEKLKYENGIVIEENKYENGLLSRKIIFNKNESTKVELKYFPNGVVKEDNLIKIEDKHNWNYVTRKKFYDNGNIEFEFWKDNESKNNVKKYFRDGNLKNYLKYWKNKEASWITERDYLICFDDNKKQTLINGNGTFFDSNESEYGKYEHIINCKKYKANGESVYYADGVIWRKETHLDGMQDGIQIEYDDKGIEKSISEYKNGKYIQKIK
jgi:antitoxin component YwqK of YwqJK toxin-antitoxin module